MKNKINAFITLFFLQFVMSMCCDCEPARKFERSFSGLDVNGLDLSGFDYEAINEPVYKSSFGIYVYVKTDLTEIASSSTSYDLSSFGFSSAYATSCHCPEDEYKTLDPINNMQIMVTDLVDEVDFDVTNHFTVYNYDGELSVSEYFENIKDWENQFRLELNNFNDIPDKALFTIKIFLESGFEIVDQTQEIEFI